MAESAEMKLIIIVVSSIDSDALIKSMLNEGFSITRISSSGGFVRRGSSTLLLGVEADKVERARQMVHEHCPPTMDPTLTRWLSMCSR